jgi:hypothetical protein
MEEEKESLLIWELCFEGIRTIQELDITCNLEEKFPDYQVTLHLIEHDFENDKTYAEIRCVLRSIN